MANIFNLSNDRTPDVDRNTYDHSFQNNLTMKMGVLYPVFCKEVLPGDSIDIQPTFALEAMPMIFPVQTRTRINLHFFYCRNRPAYEDFMNFIGNTDDPANPADMPYIDTAYNFDNICKTGSLGDYMGLPTVSYGDYRDSYVISMSNASDNFTPTFEPYSLSLGGKNQLVAGAKLQLSKSDTVLPAAALGAFFGELIAQDDEIKAIGTQVRVRDIITPQTLAIAFDPEKFGAFPAKMNVRYKLAFVKRDGVGDSATRLVVGVAPVSPEIPVELDYLFSNGVRRAYYNVDNRYIDPDSVFDVEFDPAVVNEIYLFAEFVASSADKTEYYGMYSSYVGSRWKGTFSYKISTRVDVLDYQDLTPETSPYYDSKNNSTGLKINALPFRHYEAIYNTFYRDSRNNPLMVNGKPEYNEVYLNKKGGADTTPYKLRRRNWEADFLTTAVQSPQQGKAPLVGISSTGKMTFQDESGELYHAQAKFAEDGETITGFEVLSDKMPQGTLRNLVDMASTGISIADLRQVNSLQRWLEANMRKGLRYKDQMKAHYGIDLSYNDLCYPEFIGGTSEDLRVNMVTQTTPTKGDGSSDNPDRPLGSYAGQASCVGTSNHHVNKYCDEHGYIIGILSITPVPNYSQLLPKHFLKRNLLDYYFPEFGNLGFVPIKYDEVCPIEIKNGNFSHDEPFGYQRAWYDYLASVDEVHGNFRTNMRDYLINRVFRGKPELGEDFLTVDPETVNDVFAVTDKTDDKFFGQIYFDCKMKRPIPLFGIPRIE